MSGINDLDLNAFVTKTLTDVFDTMLSMKLEKTDGCAKGIDGGNQIVGSVGFAGKVMGNVNILVSGDFARLITSQMLGMDTDEIESEEEVFDVIGELSNMLGGDIKSRLCDHGFKCDLSIPSITSGANLKIESSGWERYECFSFKYRENTAQVQVYIKTAE
ncbi:MAG: chemotaxis protein CheX [Deltaproteobacteria bacterium]|nr:chemotaxis protein CheX [Deltaproteobacteria bacterium]